MIETLADVLLRESVLGQTKRGRPDPLRPGLEVRSVLLDSPTPFRAMLRLAQYPVPLIEISDPEEPMSSFLSVFLSMSWGL